jgi:hypothetical protein
LKHCSPEISEDVTTVGFLMAAFVWWNVDWQRFIKFFGFSGPPYRRWIKTGFRIFFALCALGAGENLLRRLLERAHPPKFYSSAVLAALAWFTVIASMVKTVEWIADRKRKRGVPMN